MKKRKKLHKNDWRYSDLAGFIKRLRRLGFDRGIKWHKNYRLKNNPYEYIRTYWRFTRKSERVLFIVSPHKCSLVIYRLGVEVLREVAPTHNWLEKPFMRYFKLEEPVCLRRLGKQRKQIREWLAKHPEKNPQNAMLRNLGKARSPRGGVQSPQQLKSKAKKPVTK